MLQRQTRKLQRDAQSITPVQGTLRDKAARVRRPHVERLLSQTATGSLGHFTVFRTNPCERRLWPRCLRRHYGSFESTACSYRLNSSQFRRVVPV